MDGELTLHQPYALFHTDNPEPMLDKSIPSRSQYLCRGCKAEYLQDSRLPSTAPHSLESA